MRTWKCLETGSSSHAETPLAWPLKLMRKQNPPVCAAGAQGISQGLSSLFLLTHEDPHHENSSVHCCHLSWAH